MRSAVSIYVWISRLAAPSEARNNDTRLEVIRFLRIDRAKLRGLRCPGSPAWFCRPLGGLDLAYPYILG